MINLLFVLPSLGIGGSEHVVLELARGLDKTKFKPIIFAISTGPMEHKFKQENLITVVSNKRPGQGHLQLMAQINNIIKIYNIDIVLPHHMVSLLYSFFPARIFNRTSLYFTEHSVTDIESLSFFFKLLTIIFLFFSSGCIAISRQIARSLSTLLFVHPSKVIYIPNGIDVSRFERPLDKLNKRASLGIPEDNVIIGTVANMREVKNHKNLIKAFEKIHRKLVKVTLVLVGAGPLEDNLQCLTAKLGISPKVKFLGERTDTAELYHIFDIFCLPSFAEGFPLCLLEAMACKVPVVATNVPGNNEIVRSNGNGILVRSNDPGKLADALSDLIYAKSLRQSLGQNGFDTVCREYSYDGWIRKYEDLILEATNPLYKKKY